MNKGWLLIIGLLLSQVLLAQLPTSNIFLFDYELSKGKIVFKNPKFLTDFNSDGYNNQPYFLSAGKILITSNWDDNAQTDILLLEVGPNRISRITKTSQSEYSPTPMPDSDYFSVIRVEPSQNNAQYLWQYPLDRRSSGQALFKDIVTVGYHCWLNQREVVMFLVDAPQHKMVVGNTDNGTSREINQGIGRCFVKDGRNGFYFVDKISPKFWYIKYYDSHTRKADIITPVLEQKEDFAILSDDSILMGRDNELYIYNPKISNDWILVADLSSLGIKNITRLKVFKNKLALVNITP